MLANVAERAVYYIFFVGPVFYLFKSYQAYRNHVAAGSATTSMRRFATVAGLILLAMSQVALLLFPDVMGLFAKEPGDPSDYAYTRDIGFGCVAATLGGLSSAFAIRGARIFSLTAAYILMLLWVFYAATSV